MDILLALRCAINIRVTACEGLLFFVEGRYVESLLNT